jgi:hypothetical protein
MRGRAEVRRRGLYVSYARARGLIAGRSRGRRSLDLNTRSHASLSYSTNTLRLPTDPLVDLVTPSRRF